MEEVTLKKNGKFSKKMKIAVIVVVAVIALLVFGGVALATTYFADNPAACGKCHVMQNWVDSYSGSQLLDNTHASSNAAKCTDCHQQSVMQKASELLSFIKGGYTVSAKDVNTQSACLNCHQPDKITEAVSVLPEFVSDPKASYHINWENAKACRDPRAELVKCQDCHKTHESGVNYCATCHTSAFSVPAAKY